MRYFFSPDTITDEVKEFKFIAKLNSDGTWLEINESKAMKKSAGIGGFGMSYRSVKGKEIRVKKTIGIGKNRNGGTVGVIMIEFNSEEYKKPVSDYLASCGFKKTSRGFIASIFGK